MQTYQPIDTRITDIVIDIESLSNRFDAAIVSIGAVKFNRHSGHLGEMIHLHIDLDDAIKHGHVNGSTIAWWMGQSDVARELFTKQDLTRVPLMAALGKLTQYVESSDFVANDDGLDAVAVWGNGPIFDISAIENAYHRCGFGAMIPWKFNKIRDMRTLMDMAYDLAGFDKRRDVIHEGVEHDAMEDAVWAAKAIVAALRAIRRQIPVATHTESNDE